MLSIRIIPVLLLKNKGLVKTVQFKSPNYIGDPINAVKIFNEKEVDELIFLDITATKEKRKPNLDYLREIATECFMPLGYGGGIRSLEDIRNILGTGIEKVIINSYAALEPLFIKEATNHFGSSTIVVSIDYKKDILGRLRVYTEGGENKTNFHPIDFANLMCEYGAGELIINSINNDGTMKGYDIPFIKEILKQTTVPVVACGGAGKIEHIGQLVKETKIQSAAAGSMFIYQGKHKAVLITYPSQKELSENL